MFVTVDALTYTRLGFGGARPSPSPTIDRLLESGVTLTNLFATGCPTMFASPSIFTSALPLDEGGYGMGIEGRGESFVEAFREAGYHTGGFATGFYQGRLFGYDRGFDDYFSLYDLGLYTKVLRGLYLDYLNAMRNGAVLTTEEAVERLVPFLAPFFRSLRGYCAEKEREARGETLVPSPLLHSRCFRSVGDVARVEELAYRADPAGYAARLLELAKGECWVDILPTLAPAGKGSGRVAEIDGLLEERGLGRQPLIGPSAAYVLESLMRWIDARPAGKPFFAWAHPIDCHDLNFTSFDVEGSAATLEAEVDAAAELARALRRERGDDAGNVHYDLAIRYVDEQLGRLVDFLAERGLSEDTLLVVTSDHGGWKNGYPLRPEGTDYMSFFDELYHIPMTLVGPGLEPRTIDALSSALEVAPTLLEAAGLPIPASYQGAVATAAEFQGRPYVMMEHMASGPCDFRTKPIHLCIRSSETKVVCEIPPIWQDADGDLAACFDLAADPLEQVNLAHTGDFPESLGWLVAEAEARIQRLIDHNLGSRPLFEEAPEWPSTATGSRRPSEEESAA